MLDKVSNKKNISLLQNQMAAMVGGIIIIIIQKQKVL